MVNDGAATVTVGVGFAVAGADVPPPETVTGIVSGVPLAAVTLPVTVIAGKLWPAARESLRVYSISTEAARSRGDPKMST